jgi:hypothetical protein
MKIEFFSTDLKKYPNIKFKKIRQVEAELFYADGQAR